MVFPFKLTSLVKILLSFALCVFAGREPNEIRVSEKTPHEIHVPSGYKLHMVLSAEGDQLYRYNGSCWVSFSAKAKLYNQEKKQVGQHFYLPKPDKLGGQPSWETLPSNGVPSSLVTGASVAKITVDKNSIAWVVLKATQNKGDKDYLGGVGYVQRIDTDKGLAPSSTSGAQEGDVASTRYTANYVFYVRQ